MLYADIHCHLDEVFFKEDIDKVIKRGIESNVKIFPAGIDPITNRFVLTLKTKYPEHIFPTLGIYPPDALHIETGQSHQFNIDDEIKFIRTNSDKISGIGEVGMDFKTGIDHKAQEKIFRKMVDLAIELDLPLIIHSRKAEETVIKILEGYQYQKIVMHCFGGNQTLVKKIRENKWYLSIPTSVTRDEHFQKIVRETSIHFLLTETDSPFLAPEKGQKNEPANVIRTVKEISRIKNTPEVDVANIIFRNSKRLFNQNFYKVINN